MLEIACFNASSAVAAAKAGANRIELCADYTGGGTTPTEETLRHVRLETAIPINVMMKSAIQLLKPAASGFVFGILDEQHRVDLKKNRALVDLAAPLPCTFHRAFDQVPDLFEAVVQIIACAFTSILTSGGPADAVVGAGVVEALQESFGNDLTFILGGGVRSTNIEALKRQTKVHWYHSAAITTPGEDVDEQEVCRLQNILQGNL
ncbi:copper homeostasis CutC domain-containing protein [Clohesyomyces aquaticus]|uniref:Copper homeostasis protein cutC homolog n=1 Tax=Clohesyomyces aquaticus TaxID=1231657 RepID=A0A1Y1Z1W5_9PLEO|nr:copper homeostasis CutC domain-containing protein [Clohesyomyces aquaticus]